MKHLRIFRYVDEVARSGSIRKAAEQLNVTSSAVNRHVLDLEEELGAPLFERRPRGVRLTAAGEVFVNFLRQHNGDVERMKSQIEDLKGLRRGAVRIACSQALALEFLPREVAAFRKQFSSVSFDVKVLDHEKAMVALADYDVDLLLAFRPAYLANFQPLMTLEQRLVAIMHPRHPLAEKQTLRLRDCTRYPVAVAMRGFGGRELLDEFCARTNLRFHIAAESNSFEFLRGLVGYRELITFQIKIGAPADNNRLGMVTRQIDDRDLPRANLVLGQLRGRNLPVPAAVFAHQLTRSLDAARQGRDDAVK
ncbi:MAG TPA: LysR family transcriptional regulator [Xanthobacteraceae bacterium]|nr:LysR family transcriptional regulator [Xanthobacteraceae bacterium]